MTTQTENVTIDGKQLLAKLRPWVGMLVEDLRPRYVDEPAMREAHTAATQAKRTAEAYSVWLEAELTQAAVAWVLAGVFIRFLEDQHLIEPCLSGTGDRHARAVEAERRYFEKHPTASFTDYWLAIFEAMHGFRATAMLYDEAHTPLWRLRPSGDQAKALLSFWRGRDEAGNAPALRFDAPGQDTRFLGDLYQDLSEAARKRYALLQTPDFVEAFILDRTLEPAIAAFGLAVTTLIDPTCGSGHFLLGAFDRLVHHWEAQAPGMAVRERVLKALAAIAGVDLNPFAVAISRFRLVIAALRTEGLARLADAPAYDLNVAVGDTLLHAPSPKAIALPFIFHTADEDGVLLARIFGRRYMAVVGNPPYITVKDRALNQAYRERYPEACHKQFSLGAPFTEAFFRLAALRDASGRAGFVGMITTDSFMKREFGKKLIEQVLPTLDLTHIVSTAGAHIPGHGTPTVILFGRNRIPETAAIRVVMGIEGEPGIPAIPAQGLVWRSILGQIDCPGSVSAFISVSDVERVTLSRHPWSIGGGGVSDLKELIDESSSTRLSTLVDVIGRTTKVGEDEAWLFSAPEAKRLRVLETCQDYVYGEVVRDWQVKSDLTCIYPYDGAGGHCLESLPLDTERHLWRFRTLLRARTIFGKSMAERGVAWYEHLEHYGPRLHIEFSISFPFVATHSHFAFERAGKLYSSTAPAIKLASSAAAGNHVHLLGFLNSSTVCFWLKQVCFPKGGSGIGRGIQPERWMERFEFDSTRVGMIPIPDGSALDLATQLQERADKLSDIEGNLASAEAVPSHHILDELKQRQTNVLNEMIAIQEELDWRCYRLYGIISDNIEHQSPPPISRGERAFEISLARRLAAGQETTAWFDRHGSKPRTELPDHWPEDYREVVERRLVAIESNPWIKLIEQPTYKRRWNHPSWTEQEQAALRFWILDRLESPSFWQGEPKLVSIRDLATRAQGDADLVSAIELYAGQAGADIFGVLAPLVAAESVPFVAALRYTDAGLRKRAVWEETWDLQRREDAGENVGTIPAPPKYKREDFQKDDSWRLRGALDVPKERFISFPGLERLPDTSLVIGWAGWNHLQKAQAIAGYYMWAKEEEAWPKERLVPLLAGLVEELPWLFQWHNDLVDSSRPAEDVAIFVDYELGELGMTRTDARAWAPPASSGRRGGRKAKGE